MRPAPVQNFIDMVRAAAKQRPDGLALAIGAERRTYADLVDRASWRAREMKALGLKAGDRLGLLLPNAVEFVELLLGAAMLGVVTVPMNIRSNAVETARVIADARLNAIYTNDTVPEVANFKEVLHDALPGLADQSDPMRLALPGFRHLKAIVQMGRLETGFVDPVRLRKRAFSQPPPSDREGPDAEAPLILFYTSGTTGPARACILSSRALVSNARAIAERYRIGADDVWWCPVPMFHIGGLLFVATMFARAGLYVGMPYFSAEATFDIVERMRPTVFYPLYQSVTLALLDHPRFARTAFDSVKSVFSVAPPHMQQKIQAAFPRARVYSAYGLTETCGIVTMSLPEDGPEARLSTCGSPLADWEVRVVDPETGGVPAPGASGEIEVRGVAMFCGYFNDLPGTAAVFAADQFLRTGDLGSIDGAGRLRYHGRLRDQLRIAGETFAAIEIESFVAGHPAVKQAQVVGIADGRHGEVPVAFVELMTGASLTEAELIAYCTQQLPRHKVPRHVRFVTEWPMSVTKILKQKLRERIATEFGTASQVA